MQLAQTTHLAVHGKALIPEGQKISTSLARSASELITEYDQLKIMKLNYHTTLMDCSAMPQYSKRKVGLGMESY